MPHKLNSGKIVRNVFLPFGKNALLILAFLAVFQKFVWQQTRLCIFHAWLRLRPRIFIFPKMRGEIKNEREVWGMKNGIATLLKVIAIIFLVVGILLLGWWYISNALDGYYNSTYLVGAIVGFITYAFARGFSEVIELLQKIKDNTEKAE